MTSFILKSLILSFVFLICIQVLQPELPLAFGNTLAQHKLNLYKKKQKQFNTVFIGSSKIYRHIIPSMFDKHSTVKTKSYNLGTEAMFHCETSFILRNLLQSNSANHLDYVFVLAQKADHLTRRNSNNYRKRYYQDAHNAIFLIKFFALTNSNTLWIHLANVIKHHFFRRKGNLSRLQMSEKDQISLQRQSGFLAADQEHKLQARKNQVEFSDRLLGDIYIKELKEAYYANHISKSEQLLISDYTFLDSLCKSKEIELWFIHMPDFAKLKNHMKHLNNIIIGSSCDYPDLWLAKNRYNNAHLNKKGAQIFSKRVAEEFDKHQLSLKE